MLGNIILGLTALLSAHSGQRFQEEVLVIPAGISEITTDMEWNSMTLFSEDQSALPKIWYQKDNTFIPWQYLEEGEVVQNDALELLFAGNARKSLVIKSEATVKVIAHFFDTRIPGETFVAKFEPFDDDSFDDPVTGLARKQKPKFISRKQWGADEKLRTWKPFRGLKKFFRNAVPESKLVARFLRPKIVKKKNSAGKKLTWPLEKSPVIKKFIIHHTGEYVDEKRNPMELMRAIYYFHTISRGWGDIGYNYVIDKQGNIYEGRAGGPQIVGAHTAYHNLSSIGISLMGNFNIEKPTKAQVDVLKLLLADHSNRFNINPLGNQYFLGSNSSNISGHRDVARKGHGTACPGKNLYAILPKLRADSHLLAIELRKKDPSNSRNYFAKSKKASLYQRRILRNTKKIPEVSLAKMLNLKIMQRGDTSHLEIVLRNGTKDTWIKGTKLSVKEKPQGLLMGSFYATEKIAPGSSGVFRAKIKVKTTPNGKYDLVVVPKIKTIQSIKEISVPLQISGDKKFLTRKFDISKNLLTSTFSTDYKVQPKDRGETNGPDIKVRLAFFEGNYAIIKGNKSVEIKSDGKRIATIKANEEIKIVPIDKNRKFKISTDTKKWEIEAPSFKSEVLMIKNYDRGLGTIKYNQFRNQLNFHSTSGKNFIVVNELPLEIYLWGLAEEPKSEPLEKKHAIHVLARSYGLVYSGIKRKFKTSLYDLEDDPATSQFYLGYDWERYHSDQKKYVAQTAGKVITYKSNAVIGPYFTQSAGESSDAWRRQYPWTKKQKLPYDEGLQQKGHGIGLSGNSARELAKAGKSYTQILKYFFDGIEVKKKY